MRKTYSELKSPELLLLGARPSNVDSRMFLAQCKPIVGHLDPFFIDIMDEID